MKFARIVFLVAGVWGVLVITPLFFIFDLIGKQDPPPITHPGFYYGFATAALTWQIAFFVIASDPLRLRPLIIPAFFEKLPRSRFFTCKAGFGSPIWCLEASICYLESLFSLPSSG